MLSSAVRGWIIPAHAGFTAFLKPACRVFGDHPRTRGVYDVWSTYQYSVRGSSPHTRGLPQFPPLLVLVRGSSPHTRGLRTECSYNRRGRRIIPAHAGFTSSCIPPWRLGGDHPRTRGVYAATRLRKSIRAGSSPHTRGLLGLAFDADAGWRIIPAHAGFTKKKDPQNRGKQDHPRTRGVYGPVISPLAAYIGSSPHTRGLQFALPEQRVQRWIIPAHAGFTGLTCGVGRVRADHPRTRGVYGRGGAFPWPGGGSSPHTRGLQAPPPPHGGGGRIIPAHAGFTCVGGILGFAMWDHPRTRGVYAST